MTRDYSVSEILALVDWQRSMGVDAPLGDVPINWLEQDGRSPGAAFAWPPATPSGAPSPVSASAAPASLTPRPAVGPAPQPPPQTRPQTPVAPSAAETEARRVARKALTLEELEKALAGFDGCGLKATATKLCFYRGVPQARLMLVGEAPGRDEDLEGKPFVGRAGQLLDKMLAAIGLDESKVHITNVVYWRPPGNRPPTPQETLACRPFLERQMELVAPDMVIALGGSAAKELFGVADGIMKLRGKWRHIAIGARSVDAVATLHPAFLLRTPAAKQSAWADLLAIKAKLGLRD